ncbi:MAG: aspartate dehydrogenase [Acidimicrobiaceae bacterium]|nr:aspartate dehydrogenase [Acidimicrobiaceae bacterium]MDE0677218.1 aspartate dehydrogenase [Acidimicrobiaceae bacterium]
MNPTPAGRESLRLAFVGWGAIARVAADLLTGAPVEIVAVATRGQSDLVDPPKTARLITDPGELMGIAPQVVAEAAGRESVAEWGPAALKCGADFIVSSVSALADADVLTSLRSIATGQGVQIHIQPGALAGVEALAAARSLELETVQHRISKPPAAWLDTPAETLCNLDELDKPYEFFCANAAETATAFPKNANVAMTTALAGVGPDQTQISLVADPTATTNCHRITAHGAFGDLDVTISNNPLPANPKTSAMAALSLVRAIQNRTSAIVI